MDERIPVQSFVRGHLMRKEFHNYKPPPAPEPEPPGEIQQGTPVPEYSNSATKSTE